MILVLRVLIIFGIKKTPIKGVSIYYICPKLIYF
jgi:hypothetical protein